MTLTELRYITAVARWQHFGRAAEACFVSQPTLSVAIRKLEEELGVVIFERNRSQVTTTPTGEKVTEQARRVLEEAEMIKTLAAADQDKLAAPLKLGVIYTVGPYLIPDLIPGIRAAAPKMQLRIAENFTDALSERLKVGDLDAAILSLPYQSAGIITRALYDEPFVVALPRGHALTKKRHLDPGDLTTDALLLLDARNCFRDQAIEFCPECANSPHNNANDLPGTLEGSSIETVRQMTAAGAGITVLPVTTTQPNSSLSELLEFRPFAEPQPTRRIALAYRRSFPRPQAIALLAETIQRCAPSSVRLSEF